MNQDINTFLHEAVKFCDAKALAGAENVLIEGKKSHPDSVDLTAALGDIRLAQGRAKKAASDYQAAIDLSPETPKFLVGLASALQAGNDTIGAINALQKAVALDINNPLLHNDIGLLQRLVGQKEVAVKSIEHAIQISPENAIFHCNLGRVLYDTGDFKSARKAIERALDIEPNSIDALINLGCILREMDQALEAVLVFQKANSIDPSIPDVWLNLALALRDCGKPERGIEAISTLLKLDPTSVGGFANLGRLLQQVFRYPEAEIAFRRALELLPNQPQIMANFASLLIEMDILDEAEALCIKALQINPDHVPALSNLGNLTSQRGDQALAINLHRKALEIEPDNVKVHRNLADPLFISGQIDEGWVAYAYRWKRPGRPRRPHSQPEWMGESLCGKTLIVWPEQGVGDTVIFSTCLPDVIAVADKVIFEVDPRFLNLYQRSFPEISVVPRIDPPHPATRNPEIDLQCPVGDLGRWTRSSVSDFPVTESILQADPDRVLWWQDQLATMGTNKFKVGFYWRSKGDGNASHSAYPTLDDWAKILRHPDIDFINLQYGADADVATRTFNEMGITLHQPPEIDLFNDIDDLAALCSALDVFVGPTTLTGWLTAAVGTPALVAGLPGDWIVLGMDNLPWLPKARYIARASRSDWSSAFDTLARELETIVRQKVQFVA